VAITDNVCHERRRYSCPASEFRMQEVGSDLDSCSS